MIHNLSFPKQTYINNGIPDAGMPPHATVKRFEDPKYEFGHEYGFRMRTLLLLTMH